jgi:hypothetical protein
LNTELGNDHANSITGRNFNAPSALDVLCKLRRVGSDAMRTSLSSEAC